MLPPGKSASTCSVSAAWQGGMKRCARQAAVSSTIEKRMSRNSRVCPFGVSANSALEAGLAVTLKASRNGMAGVGVISVEHSLFHEPCRYQNNRDRGSSAHRDG